MRISLNLLVAFGIALLGLGVTQLVVAPEMSLLISVTLTVIGIALSQQAPWKILSFLTLVAGAISLSMNLGDYILNEQLLAFTSAVLYFVLAFAAQSRFMMVLSVFAIAETLGMGSPADIPNSVLGLGSASLLPTASLTFSILVLALLAMASCAASEKLNEVQGRLVKAFSGTAKVLVFTGLLVGSFAGDVVKFKASDEFVMPVAGDGFIPTLADGVLMIPPYAYLVLTVLVLAAAFNMAYKRNDKFLTLASGVFLTILFFMKWFEYTVEWQEYSYLVAGVIAVAGGVCMMSCLCENKKVAKKVTITKSSEVSSTPAKKVVARKVTKKKVVKKAAPKKVAAKKAPVKKAAPKKSTTKKKTTKRTPKK